MVGAISSYTSGAEIALKLLSSGMNTGARQAATTDAWPAPPASNRSKIVLTMQSATDYFGAGSETARSFAGLGDTVEISFSGLDIPEDKESFREDKESFRKDVLAYLKDGAGYDPQYEDHAEFLQALRAGKVKVLTVDEIPELDWQPDVGWAVSRDGYPQGGGITSKPIGNQDLLDEMYATRGQNVGQIQGHYFYAYYEK